MKIKNLVIIVLMWFPFVFVEQTYSQEINAKMFGINYWLYQSETGYDAFNAHSDELEEAGLKIIRIGGNYANNTRVNSSDRDWYLGQITRIKAMGAIPLVQLPIHLTPEKVVEWYNWFNVTNNANITYWAIGNEPDPSGAENANKWFNDSISHDGYHYTWFRGKFRENAMALKNCDSTSVIVGPSFRHFWQGGAYCPLTTYYQDFIMDIGSTNTASGLPILDIFAFNRYGVSNQTSTRAVFDLMKMYINEVNNSRPVDRKLSFAITECNASSQIDGSPYAWDFKTGQYIALLTKLTMEKSGKFVIPWSIFENSGSKLPGSSDFSLFNSDGSKRSTMWHLELMNKNLKQYYLPSIQSDLHDNVISFGMKDHTGYTVFIMNYTSNIPYTFIAKLNTSSISSPAQVKINFSGVHNTEVNGTIPAKSTYMYKFSSDGTLQQRTIYSDGDSVPTIKNYSEKYHIQNVYTYAYMRPKNGSKTENTELVQYENPDLGWSSIEWALEPALISGYFYIRNGWSEQVLNLSEDNVGIVQTNLSGKENLSSLMWKLHLIEGDKYRIENRSSGKYIRPNNGIFGTDVPIVLNVVNYAYSSFQWKVISQGLKSATTAWRDKLADDKKLDITIYPNPVKSMLNIKFHIETKFNRVELYNTSGQLQLSRNLNTSKVDVVQINVESLSSGFYILRLLGDESFIQKIFIE